MPGIMNKAIQAMRAATICGRFAWSPEFISEAYSIGTKANQNAQINKHLTIHIWRISALSLKCPASQLPIADDARMMPMIDDQISNVVPKAGDIIREAFNSSPI